MKEEREEQKQTETQEETKELEIIDEKLEAAIAPIVNTYSEITITKELFKKYCVPGASEAEVFFCMGKTRALGLDPLMPGYVHYIKFPGKPYDLFVGYPEYLKQAYANGLEHLAYEFTRDEEGLLLSVITTLDIKGRDKPFVWETWYDEVVALTKEGKPNWRWQKAPRSQLRKCGGVDTIRYSGLLTTSLPYIPEEMDGEPVADGYRTIPQSLLDAHDVEATPGEVTATDHQIGLTPLRKKYFGLLKELGMSFTTDEARRHFQKQDLGVKGNGSVSNLNAEEWGEVFVKLSLMIANKPKPEPEPPSSGDDFLENSPDVPPKQMFADESETRFATIASLMEWCSKRISSTPFADWTDKQFEIALPVLLEVPLLAAQNATGDAVQGDTPAETQEEQEQTDPPLEHPLAITPATQKALSELVKGFPGKIYMTIASKSFRARAQDATGHAIESVSDLTEDEAQAIIASLKDEKAAINETGSRVTSENVGEEITEDFVNTDEQEAKEDELTEWFNSPEYAETLNAYMTRAAGHFADVIKSTAWHQEQLELNGSPRFWPKADFAQANAALDELDLAETTKREPTPSAKQPKSDGLCTDDDFKELGKLFKKLLPDKEYAIGSQEAHDLVRESKAIKFPGVFTSIKKMTTEQTSDLILFLQDRIGAMKADAAERAKEAAKHVI